MKKLIPILVTVLLYACLGNKSEVAVDLKKERDNFYKDVLLDSTVLNYIQDNYLVFSNYETLGPPALSSGYNSELDFICNLLKEKDTLFIRSQFKNRKFIDLTALSNMGIEVVPVKELIDNGVVNDSLWNYVKAKYGEGYYVVGRPIFNKEVTQAYFRIGYLCGALCGSDFAYHMIKKKEGWRIKETIGFGEY